MCMCVCLSVCMCMCVCVCVCVELQPFECVLCLRQQELEALGNSLTPGKGEKSLTCVSVWAFMDYPTAV